VQVTATPTGRDALSVAQSTTQLSGRDLERQLGATLAKTLERQPGVAVRYNGPAASMPVLRGLTGDRILVLQDGQRAADLAGSADDHSVTSTRSPRSGWRWCAARRRCSTARTRWAAS
jgi:iron complex outermembrane recepter protein